MAVGFISDVFFLKGHHVLKKADELFKKHDGLLKKADGLLPCGSCATWFQFICHTKRLLFNDLGGCCRCCSK